MDALRSTPADIQRRLQHLAFLDKCVSGLSHHIRELYEAIIRQMEESRSSSETQMIRDLELVREKEKELEILHQEKLAVVSELSEFIRTYSSRIDSDLDLLREVLGDEPIPENLADDYPLALNEAPVRTSRRFSYKEDSESEEDDEDVSKTGDSRHSSPLSRPNSFSARPGTGPSSNGSVPQMELGSGRLRPRHHENSGQSKNSSEENSETFCICRGGSYGDMIECDSNPCPHGEWFHFDCVGLEEKPVGKWFCPDCSAANK